MRQLAFLAVLFSASVLHAQITAVDVSDLDNGQYVLTIEVGKTSIVPLTLIKPGDNPTNPQPMPTPSSGLAGIVKAQADKLPADQRANRTKVAAAYLVVAAKAKAGMITAAEVPSETKAAVKEVIGDSFQDWAAFGNAVNGWLESNNVDAVDEFVASYQTIYATLTENAAINWAAIFKIVLQLLTGDGIDWQQLLPIILEIFGGAVQ